MEDTQTDVSAETAQAEEAQSDSQTDNKQVESEGDESSLSLSDENAKGHADDKLPEFGKHPRWKKMNRELKELRSKSSQLQNQLEQLKGAQHLDAMLRANPKLAQKVMELLSGKEPEQESITQEQDPYSDYDEVIAAKLRRLDELDRKLTEKEKREQVELKQRAEQSLEDTFSDLLIDDGYLKKGETHSNVARLLGRATLSTLMEIAENPDMPTKSELKEAYRLVKEDFSSAKRIKPANVQVVPPSGSRNSLPKVPNVGAETDAQRIARIAARLSQG